MKQITLLFSMWLLCISYVFSQTDFPKLEGAYFGQQAPVDKAVVFMDGIISLEDRDEMCAAFSSDGKEFYFNMRYHGKWTILGMREVDNRWTKPVPINFTAGYNDRDFTISPDGNMLLFGSDRPVPGTSNLLKHRDIYVSKRIGPGEWSEPVNFGKPVNTSFDENYPSLDKSGNLYFFSNRDEGLGGCELYLARYADNTYQEPELLGKIVNSEQNDWDSFVDPDGSYLIFSSQNRQDTFGKQDLYISFKNREGKWTKAINMGLKVNSPDDEICPGVSPDGKYLFFTSRRRGKADIYWISAKVIEELKSKL